MVKSDPSSVRFNPEQLWIAGDGPAAYALGRLAEAVDFQVSIFPQPNDVLRQTVFNPLPSGAITAVVLFTSLEDQLVVLRHWINFPIAFLAVTGTREQRAQIISALHHLQPGATREQLDRIHCPFGLPIGAVGVEETAISMVAHLIQNRSDRRISHEAASRIRSPSLIKARAVA